MFVLNENEGEGVEQDFSEYTSYSTESLLEKMRDYGDISYSDVYGKLHGLVMKGKITQSCFNILMLEGRDFLECFKRNQIDKK